MKPLIVLLLTAICTFVSGQIKKVQFSEIDHSDVYVIANGENGAVYSAHSQEENGYILVGFDKDLNKLWQHSAGLGKFYRYQKHYVHENHAYVAYTQGSKINDVIIKKIHIPSGKLNTITIPIKGKFFELHDFVVTSKAIAIAISGNGMTTLAYHDLSKSVTNYHQHTEKTKKSWFTEVDTLNDGSIYMAITDKTWGNYPLEFVIVNSKGEANNLRVNVSDNEIVPANATLYTIDKDSYLIAGAFYSNRNVVDGIFSTSFSSGKQGNLYVEEWSNLSGYIDQNPAYEQGTDKLHKFDKLATIHHPIIPMGDHFVFPLETILVRTEKDYHYSNGKSIAVYILYDFHYLSNVMLVMGPDGYMNNVYFANYDYSDYGPYANNYQKPNIPDSRLFLEKIDEKQIRLYGGFTKARYHTILNIDNMLKARQYSFESGILPSETINVEVSSTRFIDNNHCLPWYNNYLLFWGARIVNENKAFWKFNFYLEKY